MITTVERLQWTEEARRRIVEAWKKLSRDTYKGTLAGYASRFGRSAAKAGVTDALVRVASTARKRTTAKRPYEAIILDDELEALRALVPAAPPDDVANYIVKHRRKLVFDPATKTYSISSVDTR